MRKKWSGIVIAVALACPLLMAGSSAAPAVQSTDGFRVELHAAMMDMDTHMSMPANGSVDQDFVAMMVPHHQGAIDMARIQLRYSHNPQIIRICQEIIIEQEQEIAVMRRAIGVKR